MKLNILLSIAAIYMALVGLGFIFAPQTIGRGADSLTPLQRSLPICGFSEAPFWELQSLTGRLVTQSRLQRGTLSPLATLSDLLL